MAEDKLRIQAVQKGEWISHPHAKNVLDDLDLIINQPKIDGAPMGKAVIGMSGSGKTTLLKHFIKQHSSPVTSTTTLTGQPLYVNVPSGPSLNTLLMFNFRRSK